MNKILLGIVSTPHLSITNIARHFVQELNLRHETAHKTPLDLHTTFLIWGEQQKTNASFDGLIISGITTNDDADYIRKNGGLILHIEHTNSLFKTGVTHNNSDLIMAIRNASEPSKLTLCGFATAIAEHFNKTEIAEAA